VSGVVCGSYSAPRGPFPECKGAWRPAFYLVAAKDDMFPINKRAMDPDGEGIVDVKDAGRFLQARAGDQFMCQFQCDLCHFRNIQRARSSGRKR
jgi:hypothetical protein